MKKLIQNLEFPLLSVHFIFVEEVSGGHFVVTQSALKYGEKIGDFGAVFSAAEFYDNFTVVILSMPSVLPYKQLVSKLYKLIILLLTINS